jgi:calcium/calmodulin-dependent protein kinase I
VDPSKRMTAAQCLKHPWLHPSRESVTNKDLLPHIRQGFNARRMFRKAVDVVKAVHKLSQSNLSLSKSKLNLSAELLTADESANSSRNSFASFQEQNGA